ncbi:MAG TPA: WD40 repeat domain-containing serine/threonine-protein kinase [Kofleriaceae bacterium]|nr:WD40 repeat domain-containing serine/threonine-protein kinase [Kofleriaceae bacterium]
MSSQGDSSGGHDPTLPATPADAPLTPGAPSSGEPTLPASLPPLEPPTGADYGQLAPVDPEHYAIGRDIATGGMGRIRAARDRRLGREVALKELLVDSWELRRRFEREARITARLQHPSIVNIHEAGVWPDGKPFFAMKLVAGRPLDQIIAGATGIDERLALLPNIIAAADALAYAHGERVIHRDLKPGNILVGDFGETVVIDWGLAKELGAGDADELPAGPYRHAPAADGQTVAGAVMGTPAYMPPEQAGGEPVDARADVYALGAILYQLLAGTPPFTGGSADEVLERVLERTPEPLAQRQPGLPADLTTIVEKAMARDPAARYPSAAELVQDLRRFQTGQLVASHRYSRGALLRRWARRHRALLSVIGVALAVLIAGGVYAVRSVLQERDRARAERDRANQERAVAVVERRDAEAQKSRAESAADQLRLAQARSLVDRDPTLALALLAQLPADSPLWASAQTIAWDAADRGIASLVLDGEAIGAVGFSADGSHLLYARGVQLWSRDLATGKPTRLDDLPAEVTQLRDDAHGLLWIDREKKLHLRPHGSADRVLDAGVDWMPTASPDGQRLCYERRPSPLASANVVLDVDTGKQWTFEWGDACGFSRDGRELASIEYEELIVRDSRDGGELRRMTVHPVMNERQILHAGGVWAVQGGGYTSRPGEGPSGSLWSPRWGKQFIEGLKDVSATADGSALLLITDGLLRRRSTATGKDDDAHEIKLPAGELAESAFSPDGNWLALVLHVNWIDRDRTVWLIDLRSGERTALRGHDDQVRGIGFALDSRHLLSTSQDGSVRVWPVGELAPMRTIELASDDTYGLQLSASGRWLMTRAALIDVNTGKPVALPIQGKLISSAFAPRSERLAVGGEGAVWMVDPGGGPPRKLVDDLGSAVPVPWQQVMWSPDERMVVAGLRGGLCVWDVASGTVVASHADFDGTQPLGFTTGGDLVVRSNHAIKIETRTLDKVLFEQRLTDDYLGKVVLSADGRIAAFARKRELVLLDLQTGRSRSLLAWSPQPGAGWGLDWPRPGALITWEPEAARVWDPQSGRSMELQHRPYMVRSLALAAAAPVIAAGSDGNQVQIWRSPVPVAAADLQKWLAERLQAVTLADNGMQLVPREP